MCTKRSAKFSISVIHEKRSLELEALTEIPVGENHNTIQHIKMKENINCLGMGTERATFPMVVEEDIFNTLHTTIQKNHSSSHMPLHTMCFLVKRSITHRRRTHAHARRVSKRKEAYPTVRPVFRVVAGSGIKVRLCPTIPLSRWPPAT